MRFTTVVVAATPSGAEAVAQRLILVSEV